MSENSNKYWAEVRIAANYEATEAVAEVLEGVGCHGVEYHDPDLVLDASHRCFADLVSEQLSGQTGGEHSVSGYLPVDDTLDERLMKVRAGLERVRENLPLGSGEITLRRVAEEDWAEAWKAYFHPEIIGRVVIRPSWETYEPKPHQVVVDLDPGMAFGTGTHPSTRLCLELIQDTLKLEDHVLDVGTGSGILAVAAAKLGARAVKAVDIDPVAVRVAAENIERNGVKTIDLSQGDLLSTTQGETFDLIVANIIASVIISMLPDVPKALKPGGRFLAAGIIDNRASEVEDAAAQAGLRILARRTSGEWVAYLMGG